ncbi:trypsin-like serine protease [Aureisphaera sp.]
MKKILLIIVCFSVIQTAFGQNQRIYGGETIDISEIPYQVALQSESGAFFCGGTIINESWILSAAHCFDEFLTDDPRNFIVVAGATDRTDLNSGQRIKLAQITPHPNRNGDTNDLVLLRLETPLEFNNNVNSITYANPDNTSLEDIMPGGIVRISGWGDMGGASNSTDILRATTLPIISNELAESMLGDPVNETMISFFEDGKSAGKGDSGGPGVLNYNDDPLLIGICSWGGYPRNENPSIYANIRALSNFIDEKLYECDPEFINANFTIEDQYGNEKNQFCFETQDIIINTDFESNIPFPTSFILTVRSEVSSGINQVFEKSFSQQTVNLTQALQEPSNYIIEQGIDYEVTVRYTDSRCGSISNTQIFTYGDCCSEVTDASFSTQISPVDGTNPQEFSLTAQDFELYDFANVNHHWYMYVSTNPIGGPYTLADYQVGDNYSYTPVLENLYYFLQHKIMGDCDEICSTTVSCLDNCIIPDSIPCEELDCLANPPSDLAYNSLTNSISWDATSSTGLYDITIVRNDQLCCRGLEVPSTETWTNYEGTSLIVPLPPNSCFSWKVRARCSNNSEGPWSETQCENDEIGLRSTVPLNGFDVFIYPNPNNGRMTIKTESSNGENYALNVIDFSGHKVIQLEGIRFGETMEIDLQKYGLGKGLYFFNIQTQNSNEIRKVIVY